MLDFALLQDQLQMKLTNKQTYTSEKSLNKLLPLRKRKEAALLLSFTLQRCIPVDFPSY